MGSLRNLPSCSALRQLAGQVKAAAGLGRGNALGLVQRPGLGHGSEQGCSSAERSKGSTQCHGGLLSLNGTPPLRRQRALGSERTVEKSGFRAAFRNGREIWGFTLGLKGATGHGGTACGGGGRVALAREWRGQWQVPTLAWRRGCASPWRVGSGSGHSLHQSTECIQRAGCAA